MKNILKKKIVIPFDKSPKVKSSVSWWLIFLSSTSIIISILPNGVDVLYKNQYADIYWKFFGYFYAIIIGHVFSSWLIEGFTQSSQYYFVKDGKAHKAYRWYGTAEGIHYYLLRFLRYAAILVSAT